MKLRAFVLVACLSLAAAASAHPGYEHMRGIVTQITAKVVSVQMPDKMVMTLALAPDIKFVKSGKAATAKDLKEGERVVVDYVMKGKDMIAKQVTFGAMPAAAKKAPTPAHSGGQ